MQNFFPFLSAFPGLVEHLDALLTIIELKAYLLLSIKDDGKSEIEAERDGFNFASLGDLQLSWVEVKACKMAVKVE